MYVTQSDLETLQLKIYIESIWQALAQPTGMQSSRCSFFIFYELC